MKFTGTKDYVATDDLKVAVDQTRLIDTPFPKATARPAVVSCSANSARVRRRTSNKASIR